MRSFASASGLSCVGAGLGPDLLALRPISAWLRLPQWLRIELSEVSRTGLLQSVQPGFVPAELLLRQFPGLRPALVAGT